jgi:hypothetical protein
MMADLNRGCPISISNNERPMLDILLNIGIIESSPHQSFGVKHSIRGVGVKCVFRTVAYPVHMAPMNNETSNKEMISDKRSPSVKLTHDGVIRCP